MKASIKNLAFLIIGLLLVAISAYDMLFGESDEVIKIGDGQDNSSLLYLILGLGLGFMGVMGFIREAQKQGGRKKY